VEILPGFYQALQEIRRRPIYFNHCRSEIIKIRQEALLSQFPDIKKPEVKQTIGGYLAWMHSILVSEVALIESILGTNEILPEDTESLQERTVLDAISEALTTAIKQQTDIFLGRTSPTELFELANLYELQIKSLTNNLLSYSNKLIELLYKNKMRAETHFLSIIKTSNDQIRYLKSIDCKPPGMFIDRVTLFIEILN